MADKQIARDIFLRSKSSMKEILELGEFKIADKNSNEFRYFKRVVMDQFYGAMIDVFSNLDELGFIEICPCGTTVRRGYTDCKFCNGAGFRNTEMINKILNG